MRVAALLAAVAGAAWGQGYEVAPRTPRQGDVIRLRAPRIAVSARMDGRTVRLFDGEGLMPVHALSKPGAYPLEFLTDDGKIVETKQIQVLDARFLKQNVILDKATAELQPSPDEMETVAKFRTAVTHRKQWAEPFVLPVAGCRSSPYGSQRLYNGKSNGTFHSGYDQRARKGDPVRAVASGTVRIVRLWNIHGGTVAVDHGQGVGSIYLHLSRFAVEEGAQVKQGDVIGYVGSTGRSNAPHLHWSLYVNGVAVNPGQWVTVKPCVAAKAPKRKKN
jgi:murein DD-endopeptidase MepM/ murein hydrolase activator NlpD